MDFPLKPRAVRALSLSQICGSTPLVRLPLPESFSCSRVERSGKIQRAERIAELRFNQVRQLAHSVVFDITTRFRVAGLDRSAKNAHRARPAIPEGAGGDERRNRNGLELELARAYTKIGSVQATLPAPERSRSRMRTWSTPGNSGDVLRRSASDEEATVIGKRQSGANVRSRRGEMRNGGHCAPKLRCAVAEISCRHTTRTTPELRRALTIAAATLDGEHNPPAALHAYQEVPRPRQPRLLWMPTPVLQVVPNGKWRTNCRP